MPNVRDVAQKILELHGPMTVMKLQKLVYYCQAWSVVWDDDVLFPERIEAWKNGPVVRDLWRATQGSFRVNEIPQSDSSTLNDDQIETVELVLDYYGDKDAQWLSDLTHMEAPWHDAYLTAQNTEITPMALMEYYTAIRPGTNE